MMSHCFAYPLSQNWLVIMRKVATSSSAWTNTGMWPLKYAIWPSRLFKGQFVGDVGYASGKHRQMTLRHNTVSGSSQQNFAQPGIIPESDRARHLSTVANPIFCTTN